MTTRTTSMQNYFLDNTQFKTFVTNWHANFAATGMVQTADTGQISLSAPTRPSAGSSGGYEIWRFSDALQATAPIFVKVEYGSIGSVQNANLWITVGTGSDGAGNLTYAGWPGATGVIARRPMNVGSTTAATQTAPVYFTYLTDNSWGFLAWVTPTPDNVGTWFYSIERFRNSDGTPNADGVTVLFASSTQGTPVVAQEARYYSSGAPQITSTPTYWQTVYTPTAFANAGTIFGTTIYPVPVFTGAPPRVAAPSQFVLAVGATDLTAGFTFPLDHYGTPCTWVAPGGMYSNGGFGNLTLSTTYKSIIFRTD